MSYFTAPSESGDKALKLDYEGLIRISLKDKPKTTGPIPNMDCIIVDSKTTANFFTHFGIPFKEITSSGDTKATMTEIMKEVFRSAKLYTLLVIDETLIFHKHPGGVSSTLKGQAKKNVFLYSENVEGCDRCSDVEKSLGLKGGAGKAMICSTPFLKSVMKIITRNFNKGEYKDKKGNLSIQNMFRSIVINNSASIYVDVENKIFERYTKETNTKEEFGVDLKDSKTKETGSLLKDAKEAAKVVTMSQIKKYQGHGLTQKEIEARVIACKGGGPEKLPPCPKYLSNRGKHWCALCRCNMESKTTYIASPCKIGRWAK